MPRSNNTWVEHLITRNLTLRPDFAKVFRGEGRRLDIFSWLFPHLNSKGYYYWFMAFQPEVDQWIDTN